MRNRMVTNVMVLGMGLAVFVIFQGCATHKYVDEQIGPLNQKIQSLQEQKIVYKKTQAITFNGMFIDSPGEFLELNQKM